MINPKNLVKIFLISS